MGFFQMPKNFELPPDATLARQVEKTNAFQEKVLRAVNKLSLKPREYNRLHALMGLKECTHKLLLSDIPARTKAVSIMFEETSTYFKEYVPSDTPMFHITVVYEIGLTSDRTPALRLKAIKRKIDKDIRAFGLSAIVMLEVQPLLNYPAKGDGRTLMVNAHMLAWGTISRRKFKVTKETLNGSWSRQNRFEALAIIERRLKGGIDDAQRIIAYFGKMPHDAKYLSPNVEGQMRFKSTLQGYPNILALRIIEGLSHYTIYNAIFGVREGSIIRAKWKRELESWRKKRLAHSNPHKFSIDSLWRKVRKVRYYRYTEPFITE